MLDLYARFGVDADTVRNYPSLLHGEQRPLNPNAFSLLCRGFIAVAGLTCCLSATPITYTVTNLSASGGDPTYSVASNLSFDNLTLRENFSDSSSALVTLYDFSNTARTSLDTATFDLHSLALDTVDRTHGNLLSAILTGSFSQTTLSILTSFGGTPVPATILSTFSATLPIAGNSINISATGTNGAGYAVGTLDSAVLNSDVPEPATYGVALLGLISVYLVKLSSRS